MAPRAPKPGTTLNAVRKKAKRSGFKVRLGLETYVLRKADLGPEDILMVRRQTGRPFNAFIEDFDLDSLAVIVWLSRRKGGERRLTYAKAIAEMPDPEELAELAENDELDLDFVDDLDADDEVEHEVGVIDVDEVSSDPLAYDENESPVSP